MSESLSSEQAVLSAMIGFPGCIPSVTDLIGADDFCEEEHRNIFRTILKHHHEALPLELPALAATIGKKNKLAIDTMASLLEIANTGETATYYARQVHEASRFRQITNFGIELQYHPERASEIASKIQSLQRPITGQSRLFISAKDLMSAPLVIHYLIDKIIEVETTGVIFGPSGDGKSFVALCISLCVATGRFWNGHKVKTMGLVLYLAGEGRNGLTRRLHAWHKNNGDCELPLFHLSQRTISLDGKGAADVIAEGRELAERLGVPIVLIVVDTLARHMVGDENSTKDMSAFVSAVDMVRETFRGSSAIIIHHTGNDAEKNHRSRGSSSLKAALDFEIQCKKGQLTFMKMKDTELPPPIEFKLLPVQIGSDEDGAPINSCVVEYGSRSINVRELDLTVHERLLMGITHLHSEVSELRLAFYDKRRESDPDAKHDALKKAFKRSLDGLSNKQFITVVGNCVQRGQGTFGGHSGTLSLQVEGDIGDTHYKSVPLSLPVSPHGFDYGLLPLKEEAYQ